MGNLLFKQYSIRGTDIAEHWKPIKYDSEKALAAVHANIARKAQLTGQYNRYDKNVMKINDMRKIIYAVVIAVLIIAAITLIVLWQKGILFKSQDKNDDDANKMS